MRREIDFEEYEAVLESKKDLTKNILFMIVLILMFTSIIWLLIQNFSISLFIGSLIFIGYFIYLKKKIKKCNLIITLYEEQDFIDKEKLEIKKYLNRFINLLNYLNLEESRIQYNVDKIMNMISNAESLNDFKNITEYIKEKISKYSELLSNEESDYDYTQNYKNTNAYRFCRDKNFENYYNDHQKKENAKNGYTKKPVDSETDKYLRILELDKMPSSKKELKNHYRKLLKKYHPDNIKKDGNHLSEKELEIKSANINTAYDYIEKKLG